MPAASRKAGQNVLYGLVPAHWLAWIELIWKDPSVADGTGARPFALKKRNELRVNRISVLITDFVNLGSPPNGRQTSRLTGVS
jgi:hypothetical protein